MGGDKTMICLGIWSQCHICRFGNRPSGKPSAPGGSPSQFLDALITREPHGRLIPPAKYQYTSQIYDIGTEILCKTCFGHTPRRINENQQFLTDFVQNFMYIVNLPSKQDFKHFSKIDILGFAAIVFEKVYTSDFHERLKII